MIWTLSLLSVRIVGQGLRTALVLEDDVDWDISIKSQLQTFALAVRTLQGTAHTHTQSPYGDEWDILLARTLWCLMQD